MFTFLLSVAPLAIAAVLWNWWADKSTAEGPSEAEKIKLIAQHQGKARFERWRIVNACVEAVLWVAAAAAVLLYIAGRLTR